MIIIEIIIWLIGFIIFGTIIYLIFRKHINLDKDDRIDDR